jgi:hypothetical protein
MSWKTRVVANKRHNENLIVPTRRVVNIPRPSKKTKNETKGSVAMILPTFINRLESDLKFDIDFSKFMVKK